MEVINFHNCEKILIDPIQWKSFQILIHTTLKDLAATAAERAAVRKTGRADNMVLVLFKR